jgi:hypothetical protein
MKSNKAHFLLTFEWDSKNETLEIHADNEGLEKLKSKIDSLLSNPTNDDFHLMTAEWGGNELSDKKQSQENAIINHVKIFKWNDKQRFSGRQRQLKRILLTLLGREQCLLFFPEFMNKDQESSIEHKKYD